LTQKLLNRFSLIQISCCYNGKGHFKVIERIRGNDCKTQLVGRTKTFHANLLKKYWNREQELEIPDENEMNLLTSLQTETYKDVKINPELTEDQKGEIMEVLEEFKDVFTGLTNLEKHSITLTTEVEKELDTMLKLGVIEPSISCYASPIVVVREPDGSN